MTNPSLTVDQNLLPVQAYFNLDGSFNTFIGQNQPFYATANPLQSGLTITNSTLNSSPIGATTPSTGAFTSLSTTTGQISTSPSNPSDIANKLYVDTVAQGLGPKAACAVGTTVSITLSGLQTIDTYTTLAGDRVLVKNQGTSSQNGIYIASSGAWTRSADMNVWSEVSGAYTVLLNGSQANTGWVCTASPTGTIGVTAMPWVQFSGNGTYYAGTGLTLSSNTFSITNTGVSANSYGSASSVGTFTVNAQGQLTAAGSTSIAINASQITSGTISSSLISGSYTGITGVGTLTAGTWNASLIGAAYGGLGASSLTGYLYGNGSGAATASTTIPTTALSGTITNAQLANSTISGVSLGSNLFSLTFGSGLSGSSYNGSGAITVTNSAPMVYPGSGIPNSTGTAWGTSYSTSGSGSVALTTGATFTAPIQATYETFTAQASNPTASTGVVWYDQNKDSLSYYNATGYEINIGQQVDQVCYNNTGSTIPSGTAVYLSGGSSGNYPYISPAIATSPTNANMIGVTGQSITSGSTGVVVILGSIFSYNTTGMTSGQTLYLSPSTAGALTTTQPSSPFYAVRAGFVVVGGSSTGIIFVSVRNVYTLGSNIISPVSLTAFSTSSNVMSLYGYSSSQIADLFDVYTYSGGTKAFAINNVGAILLSNSAGTTGQVLTSAGSGAIPTWTTITASVSVTDDTSTNSTRYPLFANATSGTLSTVYTSSTKYQYNPSTGILTTTGFSGSGASLTSLNASNVSSGTLGIGYGGTGLTSTPSNGQIDIGNGTGFTRTTLTAGTGITITNGSGSITVAASGGSGATISDDTLTNATRYINFTSATSGSLSTIYTSSTKLKYNPSTGAMTASSIIIAP
jgi:hypothetical protein